MNMIEVKDLSLTIGQTKILNAISLVCERGKICGLVGRNGCGKTMLMKCICGFVKPTEGTVTVDGKRIGKDCDFPESMGILIENPGFIPYYSGMRNLPILPRYPARIFRFRIPPSQYVMIAFFNYSFMNAAFSFSVSSTTFTPFSLAYSINPFKSRWILGHWLNSTGSDIFARLSLYFFICPFIIIHLHNLFCGLLADCKLVWVQDGNYFLVKCIDIMFQ